MRNVESFAIILPAAGRSVRFGGNRGKLLEMLDGNTVLWYSVRAFLTRADVESIIIAAAPDDVSALNNALGPDAGDSRISFCRGGDCRAESVRNALREVLPEIAWVAIHDAARPLVSPQLIDRIFAAAIAHGAAAAALPVSLTIKQAAGPLPARVDRTVPRHMLWAMQTPQVMRRRDLLAAFESCPLPLSEVTDDAQLIELAGGPVWLVPGEEQNLKITTRTDLRIAEMILADTKARMSAG